ncbi:MAG: UDP-N-acetylglucosamine--N-acetylmuramyl-(pentapeptide) pyrophosphoryl-undecaprenol N-acetylglucosamine transferase, partial [Blastochloris sp.]|nr:UDP-N-acetylglucosamine--N-acetylmuramyl-(pentapeptide) pyrophosphoryl-undecaprenol N-acetylglucosamine transferase [Blastochloris sp.]
PAAARAHFQLDAEKITLLVFGGSKGARSINGALLGAAPALIEEGVQILHITGKLDWESLQPIIQTLDAANYRAFPYLHEDMALAMCAADLVVSRGGAECTWRISVVWAAAVIVPYPYAWRYQRVNAAFLQSTRRGGHAAR